MVNNCLVFEIQDTGSGIKNENVSSLGNLYSTFDNKNKENSSGIGLGLNLV